MTEPAWVTVARSHIGTREIPGAGNEMKILTWWKAIRRSGIKSDEVPWCAAFVGACLEEVGILSSRFESARSYMSWGIPIPVPVPGCVAVFARTGGGHVGFVVGAIDDGRLLVLGGNQSNAVSISPFDRHRVIGYRWPRAVPIVNRDLPILPSKQKSSINEA